AQMARRDARVVVICGDGAFQMTGQELSSIIRCDFDPIVIVLDNGSYGTEEKLHPGGWRFNQLHRWNYHQLPAIYGKGRGYLVRTEGEFDRALTEAWADRTQPSLLQVQIDPTDHSATLGRLAERLGN